VARSKELPAAVVLVGSLAFLSYASDGLLQFLQLQMRELFRMRVPAELTISMLQTLADRLAWRAGAVIAPFMLVALALGIGANAAQGFAFSWEPLGFNIEKLSPKTRLSRLFSTNGVVELVKSLALVGIVSFLSYQVVVEHMALYPRMVLMDVRQILVTTGSIAFQVCLRVSLFLLVLAAADYGFQKYRFLQQLKMTKQEVKDDMKESEGNPFTRARVRRIQREMARRRMMADVPKADVVITNPTHYAIALAYDMKTMDAPKVVAKGVGFLAQRIKELAREHSVPLVENKPLAQTLYKTVKIGETIPAHLFRAVAEILAYIYRARSLYRSS
jgi:flagellar biosynthetic protein FlhB